jgi:hypothetical protein
LTIYTKRKSFGTLLKNGIGFLSRRHRIID